MRRYGNKPRTQEARKTAVYMRLVDGRGKPVTLQDMLDAGYRQDEAEGLLKQVRQRT